MQAKHISRHEKVRVRTAKGRTNSSTRWLSRQLNDPYVAKSKLEGYRSRAAYKLLEIDDCCGLLKPGRVVIDLGSAPGGWSQVASQRLETTGLLIAADISSMLPVPGCQFVQGNFGDISVQDHITALMGGRKADVILSDMASQSCGHPATDHLRIMSICELVFEFAQLNLAKNGTVVTKMWLGGGEHELVSNVRPFFTKVSYFKPKASRSDSAEMYLLASGFKM